jgi:hypothetical protein
MYIKYCKAWKEGEGGVDSGTNPNRHDSVFTYNSRVIIGTAMYQQGAYEEGKFLYRILVS